MMVLVIAAIGVLARLPAIFEWWLNPDEGINFSMLTWEQCTPFLEEMLANSHPPLFYLIIKVLGLLTTDFVVIRGVSVAIGTTAIFAAWLAGRELASPWGYGDLAGVLSAALVAVSPGAIVMSQLIRPYMMQLTFILLALYHLLRALRGTGRTHLIWYGALLSLAIGTHYGSVLAALVFAAMILWHSIVGGISRGGLIRLLAAHVPPALVCLGLYLVHVRPHLVGSALAAGALEGWLAPRMIDSATDVGFHFFGFVFYWHGAWLAIPAAALWAVGLVLSIRAGSRIMLAMNLSAFGIAVIAAAVNQYPFGASRHTTWLFGFFAVTVASACAQVWSSAPRRRTIFIVAMVCLSLTGYQLGRLARERGDYSAESERVLRKSDVPHIESVFADSQGPEIVLMSLQSYYLLIPLYAEERQLSESPSDAKFFTFRWSSRTVVVARSWNFTVRPDEIGEPNHLCTFTKSVDRLMPELRLAEQPRVLVVFGGWPSETPGLLLSGDRSLPPGDRLVTHSYHVPGFTAFVMDVARYRLLMRELLQSKGRRLGT